MGKKYDPDDNQGERKRCHNQVREKEREKGKGEVSTSIIRLRNRESVGGEG